MTCTQTGEYAILWVANVIMLKGTRKAPKAVTCGLFYSLIAGGLNS